MKNPKSKNRNPKGFLPVPPWGVKGGSLFSDFGFRISDFRHNGKEVAGGH